MKQYIKDKIIDFLEGFGPIIISILVVLLVMCCFNNFYTSENFSDVLTSCITINSIFIGIYSAIMPIIFGMKNNNKLFKKVLENKKYKKYLIIGTISGFISMCLSLLLYFRDLYDCNLKVIAISGIWVFFLVHFLLSNVRIVIITIYMLLSTDEEDVIKKDKDSRRINENRENNKQKMLSEFKEES